MLKTHKKHVTTPLFENKTINVLIGEQAALFPDKIAIKHRSETITYKELDISSGQVASFFQMNKFGAGDIIAVAMERSIDMAICLLAIMKAGAVYLPVDPNLPLERVDFLISDCSAKVLCTSKNYAGLYKDYSPQIIFDDIWAKRAEFPAISQEVNVSANLAYILYTSGSTGFPKGVEIAHYSLLNLLKSIKEVPGINAEDIILGITTMSFDISELELFLPLISGAQLTIVDSEVAKDGRALLEFIEAEKVTIVQATPFTWRMMLEYGWEGHLPIKAFCGGEAMTKDLADKLLARCNEVWNMYGPTETTIYSLIKKIVADEAVITIGKPIANTEVFILDDKLNEAAEGQEGDIYIGGAGVAMGYVGQPELTKEKFIDYRFSKADSKKIYKTGDLGKRLGNGEVQCLGRIDHQIKIRGYRIETEEIEYQLKLQNDIKDALVVLHKDSVDNLRLVAYVALKTGTTGGDTNTWKERLKETLPDYMVPTDYMIIPAIPLMPNGKIDRKGLPKPELRNDIVQYVAPKTDTEKSIAKIWMHTFGIKKIGINDDFFDLGGNSLIATKIMTQIEKLTGRRLPLSNLFNCPDIKQLASAIATQPNSTYRSLVPIKENGTKVPLYIVHGIGLNLLNLRSMIVQLDKEQPVYGLQAIGLDGESEALNSIEEIAAFYNHEIISQNPAGPYALAGYSYGGYIAFEMARQLKTLGKDVRLLVMFDTNLQWPTHQYPTGRKIYAKAFRQIPKLIFRAGSFFREPVGNLNYLTAFFRQKTKLLLKGRAIVNEFQSDDLPDFMHAIVGKLEKAFYKYVVKPTDVKIHLFKAGKRIYYVDDPQLLGWGKYALKGVDVHVMPGDHKEMLIPPNDKVVADNLQQLLNGISIQNNSIPELLLSNN